MVSLDENTFIQLLEAILLRMYTYGLSMIYLRRAHSIIRLHDTVYG